MHVVWMCSFAKAVWKLLIFANQLKRCSTGAVVDLIFYFASIYSSKDFRVFVTISWSIWNDRNRELQGGKGQATTHARADSNKVGGVYEFM